MMLVFPCIMPKCLLFFFSKTASPLRLNSRRSLWMMLKNAAALVNPSTNVFSAGMSELFILRRAAVAMWLLHSSSRYSLTFPEKTNFRRGSNNIFTGKKFIILTHLPAVWTSSAVFFSISFIFTVNSWSSAVAIFASSWRSFIVAKKLSWLLRM